jgi:hypothetical protein
MQKIVFIGQNTLIALIVLWVGFPVKLIFFHYNFAS